MTKNGLGLHLPDLTQAAWHNFLKYGSDAMLADSGGVGNAPRYMIHIATDMVTRPWMWHTISTASFGKTLEHTLS
jgi:hypothetical protein